MTNVPCHSAGEICVFDAPIDNPVELSVRVALAEAGNAFWRDGDGIECPLVRINVVHAHVCAFRVRLAAIIEFDG